MSNLGDFGSFDASVARDEANRLQAKEKPNYYKFKNGRNTVRIVPPSKGQRSPFKEIFQHFVPTPSGIRAFVCPRRMGGGECLVCEKANEMNNIPGQEEQARNLFAKRKFIVNVIDRDDEDKGPQVMSIGKTVYEGLMKLAADPVDGGDFTHPVDGYDVIIERSGSGFNTTYTVRASRSNSPLHAEEEVMKAWFDAKYDLEVLGTPMESDKISGYLKGEEAPSREALPEKVSSSTAQQDVLDVSATVDSEDDIPF